MASTPSVKRPLVPHDIDFMTFFIYVTLLEWDGEVPMFPPLLMRSMGNQFCSSILPIGSLNSRISSFRRAMEIFLRLGASLSESLSELSTESPASLGSLCSSSITPILGSTPLWGALWRPSSTGSNKVFLSFGSLGSSCSGLLSRLGLLGLLAAPLPTPHESQYFLIASPPCSS